MDLEKTFQRLLKEVTPANLFTTQIQSHLRLLPLELREELAYQTHTMVVYYGQEVVDVRDAEEKAALRAMPQGYTFQDLNGINIGCGDRIINQFLIGTDAHKGTWEVKGADYQIYESRSQLLCWAHDLPFKNNSIDYMIALHILEHTPDPISVVLNWLDMLKPGGGLGIIVPDWRYTWDARNDQNIWSHRWNPTPKLVKALFDEHWSKESSLEHICTYKWKLSFDFVLRKHGKFSPFNINEAEAIPTGKQLFENRLIFHSDE